MGTQDDDQEMADRITRVGWRVFWNVYKGPVILLAVLAVFAASIFLFYLVAAMAEYYYGN